MLRIPMPAGSRPTRPRLRAQAACVSWPCGARRGSDAPAIIGARRDNLADAVQALGPAPRRVFVPLGRNELAALTQAPRHFYLIRSVDPVEPRLRLPQAIYVTGRGPFSEADEIAMMRMHGVDIVIAKNSGGDATYGKIAAARALGVPVIMLRRPLLGDVPSVETVAEAVAFIDHALGSAEARGV